MKTPEQIAQELAEHNTKLILEARQDAVQKAIAKGYSPDEYYFTDNISEVINDPSIPYKVVLQLRVTRPPSALDPIMTRANLTKGE